MTARRRSSGARNMMKPPPPAPDTLPAVAPAARATASAFSICGLLMPRAISRLLLQPASRVRETSARSPFSSAFFMAMADCLRLCVASIERMAPCSTLRDCSATMVALFRLSGPTPSEMRRLKQLEEGWRHCLRPASSGSSWRTSRWVGRCRRTSWQESPEACAAIRIEPSTYHDRGKGHSQAALN